MKEFNWTAFLDAILPGDQRRRYTVDMGNYFGGKFECFWTKRRAMERFAKAKDSAEAPFITLTDEWFNKILAKVNAPTAVDEEEFRKAYSRQAPMSRVGV